MNGNNDLTSPDGKSHRFRLAISATEDSRWRVRAQHGAEHAEAFVPIPTLPEKPAPNLDEVRELGSQLYLTIFPSAIDQLLEVARFRADGTSLAIEIAPKGDLAELPWEWLFDPEAERFLALAPRTPSTRWEALDLPADKPPSSRTLRVGVQADAINEEVLALVREIGADPAIEVRADSITRRETVASDVMIAFGRSARDAKLVIAIGETADPSPRVPAAISIPDSMPVNDCKVFLSYLTRELAHGAPVDVATTAARRKLAEVVGIEELTWSMPRLTIRQQPAPLVRTTRRATEIQAALREHSVGWLTDSLSGVVISVAVFLAGIILYRVGFSSSQQGFELDILSPISLYDSFKALVVELSTYDNLLLLGITGVLLALTVAAGMLWLVRRQLDPEERANPLVRYGGPLGNVRASSVLGIAMLTVLSAFLYQQYVWHIRLPIDHGALGIAITKASAGEDFDDLLTARLATSDPNAVVRTLPLNLDAGEIARARDLAARIDAQAVVIAQEHSDTSYVGYVVFSEAASSGQLSIPEELAAISESTGPGASNVTPAAEHLAVPVLHAETPEKLAEAVAGVLAYERGDFDVAIAHLANALPDDPMSPKAAIINFYLANALQVVGNPEEAAQAFANAAAGFESTSVTGKLGPLDELLLVKSYLALGNLSVAKGENDQAITWYQKAVGHRRSLLARAEDLPNPAEFHLTYAELYNRLATVYSAKGIAEEERYWQRRFEEETAELSAQSA